MSKLRLKITTLIALFSFYLGFSQVTSLDLQMRFNSDRCSYDYFLIINSGSAVTHLERTQAACQISFAVPTGSAVTLDTTYNPKINNFVPGTGTSPVFWSISNSVISPSSNPQYDYISYGPILSPTARYDELSAGDTVKLFSLFVEPSSHGVAGVRLWENGVDPGPNAPGMNGGNFSNGITIGSQIQRYRRNLPQVYPNDYADISGQYTIAVDDQTELIKPSPGTWTNLTPTLASISSNTVTALNEGVAKFQFTPSNGGCFESTRLNISNVSPALVNTGIGTYNPNSTAILDITSTLQGIKPPCMTELQKDDHYSTIESSIIYQTDKDKGYYYYENNTWKKIDASGPAFINNPIEGGSSQSLNSNETQDIFDYIKILEEQVNKNHTLIESIKKELNK